MSHYAKVLDGKVVNILVADASFISSFVDETPGKWIETSKKTHGGVLYNEDGTPASDQSGAIRKNYATVGGNYDVWNDVFYDAQPFPSWTLNESTYQWESPLTRPGDDYYWDEVAYQADKSKGWTPFPR